MDKIPLYKVLKQLGRINDLRLHAVSLRYFSTINGSTEEEKFQQQNELKKVDISIIVKESLASEEDTQKHEDEQKSELTGFAKSYQKFSNIGYTSANKPENYSFAHLLRHSEFMNLGDPTGKIVVGQIFEVVGNELHIDFGGKFPCICLKPAKNAEAYVRGARVRLKIKELELSTRFLGATTDFTTLEADCILLGLISSPVKVAKASNL